MKNYTIQLLICIMVTGLLYLRKYNLKSNKLEETEGKIANLKEFWIFNRTDILASFITAFVVLIILNELGLQALNAIPGIRIPETNKIVIGTTAIIAGLFGEVILRRILKKGDQMD